MEEEPSVRTQVRSHFRSMLAAASVTGLLSVAALPAAAGSVWDGVFASAQVPRGEKIYNEKCAPCHLPDLSGREPAPELAGDKFMSKWNGHTLEELYVRISTTMPQGQGGSLTPDEYRDVVALLLDANGFPSGKAEISKDATALKGVTITSQK
jgi:mono/diheme cytochrome c family protein